MNTDSSFRQFPFDPVHPHVPFADDEIEQSIPERFEQQVRAAGDRLAIKSPERSFTYTELNQTANRLARKILSLRGKHAEAIALMFDHDAGILAAILAVLKTGKFYVVLDPTYPRERLAYMVADSGAALIITDRKNFSAGSDLAGDEREVVSLDVVNDGFSGENLEGIRQRMPSPCRSTPRVRRAIPRARCTRTKVFLSKCAILPTPGISVRTTAGCCIRR